MSRLPPRFCKIRMELAREPGRPHGDSGNGYEFVAPLDDDGRIDAAEWSAHPGASVVRRFVTGLPDRKGVLARGRDGEWLFDYDPLSEFDDEAGFRFGAERFVPGEYISVVDEDEVAHTYRIVSVERP